jgi:formiminoglutamase
VGRVAAIINEEIDRLGKDGCAVHISLDADVVSSAVVPGESAPNVNGLAGSDVLDGVEAAGRHPSVHSLELVEINPRFDVDGHSGRWAALAVWRFLIGVLSRCGS